MKDCDSPSSSEEENETEETGSEEPEETSNRKEEEPSTCKQRAGTGFDLDEKMKGQKRGVENKKLKAMMQVCSNSRHTLVE